MSESVESVRSCCDVCAGFGIENGECLGDVIEKEMSDQVGRP